MSEKSEWDWIRENKDVMITLAIISAVILVDRLFNLDIISMIRVYVPATFKFLAIIAFGNSFYAYVNGRDKNALYYMLVAMFSLLLLIFLEVSGGEVF